MQMAARGVQVKELRIQAAISITVVLSKRSIQFYVAATVSRQNCVCHQGLQEGSLILNMANQVAMG